MRDRPEPARFLFTLLFFGLLASYALLRGWQALAGHRSGQRILAGTMILLFLSFPFTRLLVRSLPRFPRLVLGYLSNFYLAALIYACHFIVLIDLLRLANALFGIFPGFVARNPHRSGLTAFWVVLAATALILMNGYMAAVRFRTRRVDLILKPGNSSLPKLDIVLASDFHLSAFSRMDHLRKIASGINRLRSDLILLPGDILDMNIPAKEKAEMISLLRSLRAPLGVFAVTGNHEISGGEEQNVANLAEAGIKVLEDEWIPVGGAFYLVGRRDMSIELMGLERKPLSRILEGTKAGLPRILMDHQPFHLEEAERSEIDLQVSGHTHAGQIFPLTIVNKRMYERNWGYLRRGMTQYYVTCGVGTWGLPIRTGSKSEIVHLRISFRNRSNSVTEI